ncbi:hypothetical protein [Microbacterium sp. 1.5R]|uniref:hypothetical protein n=1 Tax=Microbacterium sp. 1.5R TaxID=1916917 RepID=UPI00119DB775|nr:hypothetical protein [Microbacterium sp. 1.5R]
MNVGRARISGAAAVCGAVAIGVAGVAATPAWAAPSTEVVQSTVLRIVSVADWTEASSLLPGESVQWDVAVSADPASEPGTVTLAVSARGAAPLIVDAALCMQAWADDECPGGATVLATSWSIPRDGGEVVLTDFSSTRAAHLRLHMALPEDHDGPGLTDVRVTARGVGDAVVAGTGGALPATGGAPPTATLVGSAALLALGASLLARGIRVGGRRRHGQEGPS